MSSGWRKNGSQRLRLLARIAPEILVAALRSGPIWTRGSGQRPRRMVRDGAKFAGTRSAALPVIFAAHETFVQHAAFGTWSTRGDGGCVLLRCRRLHLLEAAGVHTGGSVSRHPK